MSDKKKTEKQQFIQARYRPLEARLDDLIKHISEGWSVSMALRKSGFTDNERYSLYQKNMKFRAVIDLYNLKKPRGRPDWKVKGA